MNIKISILLVLSLIVSFLFGRGFPPASLHEETPEAAARASSRTRLPETPAGSKEIRTQATAASRTLDVLAHLDACRSSDDFRTAISSILSSADKAEKERFLALVFSRWLEDDPLTAFAEVRRVEMLRHSPGRVARTFQVWASENPEAATALLQQTLDGRQSDPSVHPPFLDGIDPPEFLLSLVTGLGTADPGMAAATLTRSVASPVRTTALEVLLQDWYPTDPEAVRAWAAGIPDPQTRCVALTTTGNKAGQQDDIDSALNWATTLPSREDSQDALLALTSQWAQRHSADASAWVRTLPDGPLKFALMPGVMSHLAIIDPGAAADWLNEYEASPNMDASIAAYAKAIHPTNPAAARGSAAAITDPHLRESLTRRLLRAETPPDAPSPD